MAYIDVETLKAYLGIDSEDDTDEDILEDKIEAAQAWIDRHCGQTFEAGSDSTRYYQAICVDDGGPVDGRDLILDAPLCAITSVTNGDGSVVSASNYVLLPINGTPKYAIRLKRSSGLSWTYSSDVESDLIAVVGKFAFSEIAPPDVAHACKMLAAWLYRRRENASPDLDRTVVLGDATVLPARMPQDVIDFLRPYVRGVS